MRKRYDWCFSMLRQSFSLRCTYSVHSQSFNRTLNAGRERGRRETQKKIYREKRALVYIRMGSKYLFILVILNTAFSSSVGVQILVHKYTSIDNGEFVFRYEEGQDAVIALSFTPKDLNANNIEVVWRFKNESGNEQPICGFVKKPFSLKDRVEFSGNFSRQDVSITIHKTSKSDSGHYTCIVDDDNNMRTTKQSILLKIFEKYQLLLELPSGPLLGSATLAAGEASYLIKEDKGVLFDTESKLVFIGVVVCMAIILACTVIVLVRRRQKEERGNGTPLKGNEDHSNEEKV
uniref:myelin protein P0-like isoform X1 n=2 Tax=Myxine glutinosa TaxID=7769 RepID=UPI00358EE1DC